MTPRQFETLCNDQMKRCLEVLAVKKQEYSQGRDRLDQFKRGAEFLGKHPMEVLAGMMLKHTTSIYDCIEQARQGKSVELDKWQEKITDHINYLLLLLGLAVEGIED